MTRTSGKYFYILLQGLDENKVAVLIDKIRAIVSKEMFSFEGEDVFVTCSGGIAHSLTDRLIDQVAIAEDLVASAKASGKNIVFSEDVEANDNHNVA